MREPLLRALAEEMAEISAATNKLKAKVRELHPIGSELRFVYKTGGPVHTGVIAGYGFNRFNVKLPTGRHVNVRYWNVQ